MPTPRQRAYSRKLNEIFKRYEGAEEQTIRLLIGQLQELRKSLAGSLTNLDPSSFEASRLLQLQADAGASIDVFKRAMNTGLSGNLENIYELGELSAIDPLTAADLPLFYTPNIAQLNVISGFSADLINNISEPMRQAINAQIRLSALGGESPYKAMQAITKILGLRAYDGVWGIRRRPDVIKGIAARGEAILRTELTRIFNLANHSQQQELARQDDGIRKVWIATGDSRTRASHLQAHVYYNDNPIPINEPFIIGGIELRFPGDPLGTPGETINCRCRTATIHVDIGVIKGPLDAQIERERQRRAA